MASTNLVFTVHMIDTNNQQIVNVSSQLVRTQNINQTHSELVIHTYRVTAPKSSDVVGPLDCACKLFLSDIQLSREDMRNQTPHFQLQKTRRIHIDVRLKPIIFEKQTVCERSDIEKALHAQAASSISSAFAFHKATPKLLEDNQAFFAHRTHALFMDSGLYSCSVSNCQSIPKCVGVEERQLIVLPDSSIIQMRIHAELDPMWREQRCRSHTNAPVKPGDCVPVSCQYPIAQGLPIKLRHGILHGKADGAQPSNGTLITLGTLVIVRVGTISNAAMNISGIVTMPSEVRGIQLWQVTCQLSYDKFSKVDSLAETISGSSISKTKILQVFQPIKPKLLHESIQSDRTEVAEKLKSADAKCPDGVAFRRGGVENLLEEGLMTVQFVVDKGVPEGWVLVWLVHQEGKTTVTDSCPRIHKKSAAGLRGNEQTVDAMQVSATCVLQLEHVALFVAVVNIPGTDLNRSLVESELREAVSMDVHQWLENDQINQSYLENTTCFNKDYRMIQLRVGWRASVTLGSAVLMKGRLRHSRLADIQCYRRDSLKTEPKPIQKALDMKSNETLDYITLRIQNAQYDDNGIYHCNTTNQSNSDANTVISARKLIVLPDETAVKCALTLDSQGQEEVSDKQQTSDGIPFLLANQTAYAHCERDETLTKIFPSQNQFHYLMKNEQTNQMRELEKKQLKDFEAENPSIRQSHQIVAVQSKDYTGLLSIRCGTLYNGLSVPVDLVKRNETSSVECNFAFTIQEPATGMPTILTIVTDYEHQPVPLDTEFTCAGGYGLPPLSYRWEPYNVLRYEEDSNGPDLASLLPGSEGGWGGPKQPFTDTPSEGLILRGDKLRVPDDPKYRGMTYAYTCIGTNEVQGQAYEIRKTISFSIAICPTKYVKMDLSILLTRKLLASCALAGSPDPDIHFYGHYFLTFVRQIILGLPYGKKNTEFNILVDDIFSDKADSNSFGKSIRFEDKLSRIELARRLYSRDVKPTTMSSGCDASRISLKEVIKAVIKMRPQKPKRKHIVLLTLDRFVNMDLLDEVRRDVSSLETRGTRILLAVTHAMTSEREKLHNELLHTLNPINFTTILPTFESNALCESCQPQWDDPVLRIKRESVFNALCDAVGSRLTPRASVPDLRFPLPRHNWFIGMELGISCLGNLTQRQEEHVVAELIVCHTNQTLVNELTKKRLSIQLLLNACKHKLASTQKTMHQSTKSMAVVTSTVLDPARADNVILCIQRQGDPEPQLYDAVNYAWTKLTMIQPKVRGVRLVMATWPNVTTRAAALQCHTSGFAPGMETLFLLKKESQKDDPQSKLYHVLGRQTGALTAVGTSKFVSISWLEIDLDMTDARLYCLLWPKAKTKSNLKSLDRLPEPSDMVHISKPITNLLIIPSCPTAPKITFEPDLEKSLYPEKTRLDVTCEGAATADALPFKLYYLSSTFSIIICSHESVGQTSFQNDMLPEQEVPCSLTSHSDTHCTKLIQYSKVNEVYYPARCTFTRRHDVNNVFRRVQLAVTMLRREDFGARVFCEVIDLYAAKSAGDKGSVDLRSEVKTVTFSMPTQILQFFYQPESEIWICKAAAFPFSESGSIEVMHTSTVWLEKQLGYYDYIINLTQPHILHRNLLPKRELVYLNHTITISFVPSFEIPGGLRSGHMTLRCSLGNAQSNLTTTLPNRTEPEEPINKVPSVPEAGKAMHFSCQFPEVKMNTTHAALHRIIHTSWLSYDITVSYARLIRHSEENEWERIPDRQLRMHGMGLWGAGMLGLTTMMTANESNEKSVGFTSAFTVAKAEVSLRCVTKYTSKIHQR
ncbi:unnamed protein product [Echinostoma caproni]|uniref:AAA domain-containing protein n=1 Tax=Echinostoma caproni TaxID=27848 RepID=A0A183ATN7_9TREM|nr:unnamed protein product [Echinostoma caproni]